VTPAADKPWRVGVYPAQHSDAPGDEVPGAPASVLVPFDPGVSALELDAELARQLAFDVLAAALDVARTEGPKTLPGVADDEDEET
jgi:hypothetical protein